MSFLRTVGHLLTPSATSIVALTLAACSTSASLSVDNASIKTSHDVLTKQEGGDESTRHSRMRTTAETCSGYDLTPETRILTISALKEHLAARGISYSVEVERQDLHLFDLEIGSSKTRLRVATLDSRREAGHHLKKALLEHGAGYWGVHRSNLAVLAPAASPKDAAQFGAATGLTCWGVFTQVGLDDAFAVPGGYFEL